MQAGGCQSLCHSATGMEVVRKIKLFGSIAFFLKTVKKSNFKELQTNRSTGYPNICMDNTEDSNTVLIFIAGRNSQLQLEYKHSQPKIRIFSPWALILFLLMG